MAEFRMPSLGADMEAGTLLEWLVRPGDTVAKGDTVAVVDTDKAAIEVECFEPGVVQKLLVEPGARVPVGDPLAVVAPAAEPGGAAATPSRDVGPTAPMPDAHPAAPAAEPSPSAAREAHAGPPQASPLVRHLAAAEGLDLGGVPGTGRGGQITRNDIDRALQARRRRRRSSPLARRLAAELGVDLASVTGTGVRGAIQARDVRAACQPSEPRPETAPPAPRKPQQTRRAALREATAKLMARSNREIPHYYLSTAIDLASALDWLTEHNRQVSVAERMLPAALLLKAAARAAEEVPELNGHWVDGRFQPAPSVRLGVAVSLRGGGLVVPGIDDAASLALPELMARIRDLATRARTSRLRTREMADPSITVSNLGESDVENLYGVIYPPQVALVGFGAVVERAWAVNGLIGARPVVTATLSGDHRATDGVIGARYLQIVSRLLQETEEL